MILYRKGFNIRQDSHDLLNCIGATGTPHCIKGTEANAEDGEISQIREGVNRWRLSPHLGVNWERS
jgi:hypothetical protein